MNARQMQIKFYYEFKDYPIFYHLQRKMRNLKLKFLMELNDYPKFNYSRNVNSIKTWQILLFLCHGRMYLNPI